MSGYEKRILYFDEIENGRKVKNAGFTKLILQGEQCRLSVNINGLHKTDTIQCDLMLLEDEKEVALSRIALQQGRCNYSCLLTREQMGRKGISLEDAYGVCVRLSEQRFLKAVWRERRAQEQSGARKNTEEQQMPDVQEIQEIQQGQGKQEAQEVRPGQGKPEAREIRQGERKSEVWQIQQEQREAEVWEVPEGQGMSEEQGLPEEQGMPEEQGLPQEQKALETHVVLENQRKPEVREMPEEPKMSEVYGMPEEQKASQMRGIPKEPGMPESWEIPEKPSMPGSREISGQQSSPDVRGATNGQSVPETEETPKIPMASQEYEMSGNQNVLESRKTVKVQGIPERGEEIRQQAKCISDDKWKQLECVFPIIHPFGDKREYLSIAPKDFIVLTREYQSLANNSFLLHGFYNYHHIILGKIPIRGKELFFLGVPGVFYEREKAVAIMFGFESFECAKEPAETGTFGYYMKRVEI